VSSFLIVFDRELGELLEMTEFDTARQAEDERIQLELAHRREPSIEIVVLEADSREQLRSTHARYFGSRGLEDLARAANPGRKPRR
jgi:hypothetical protein